MSSSSTQHTPGPWLTNDTSVYALEHYAWRKGKELFQNRFYVSVQGPNEVPREELEANARLIAAAPEMLEVLKAVSEAYQQMFDVMPVAWQGYDELVSTVIAKAEGR